MNFKSTYHSMLIAFYLIATQIAFAQKEIDSQSTIDTYNLPKVKEKPKLKYPRSMERSSQEGWVDISYMVDVTGKTFEATVIDKSHGDDAFTREALRAVGDYIYYPANVNGVPVEASQKARFYFLMDSNYKGTSSKTFYTKFKAFNRSINNNEQAKAKKFLDDLADGLAKNLYDDTYLNLAHYLYEYNYGSKSSGLFYLSRMLNDPRQSEYLPTKLYNQVLTTLFSEQIDHKYFGEALETYSKIKELDDNQEFLLEIEPIIDKIDLLRTNNEAYSINSELDASGNWYVDLFKSSFSINEIKGKVSEIQLRCSKKYIFFEYLPNKEYHIPDSYGKCHLNLIGDPESSFEFLQFAS